ncbi:hypothetical protein A8B82_15265 [Sulfitobacter sp. EhC04]|uniref:hypothetical protein n=1 Tax=Sulfitobacter sp. EhC04 TaxID=1849168 RepID=UPI0007F4C2B6|nr:hypothetical protein [Sulfitobacter sp. EhC04]OAN76749.1 hypothetical protein A8B82_15265 [Sulfitobacter sp. EhC04]
MKCLILKTFEYTDEQNVGTKTAFEDTTVEIPDDLVAGLFKEGFLTDPENPDVRYEDRARSSSGAGSLSNKDAGASSENAADLKGAQNDPDQGDGQGTTVEIPEGWADLSAKDLRELADKFAETPTANKDEAVEAIKAEIAKREQAQG